MFFTLLEQEVEGRAGVKSHQKWVLFEFLDNVDQFFLVFDARMGENYFTLETTILASNLELLRFHLKHLQSMVNPLNELDSFGQLTFVWHSG